MSAYDKAVEKVEDLLRMAAGTVPDVAGYDRIVYWLPPAVVC